MSRIPGYEHSLLGGVMYLKSAPSSDHIPVEYPTIDPDGSVPEVYSYVYNNIFGSSGQIHDRDALSTLNPSDPNIADVRNDSFTYAGYEIFVPVTVMNDGSRWFDLSGDGKAETHIQLVGGALYYDSDLNGTYDTAF